MDAINAVLKHYEGYIAALSMRTFYDESGNPHLCVGWMTRQKWCIVQLYPLPANQRALLLWLTRAQKQSSFCLLQNRRPESQSPTFHRPADRGYNTLDFASKVRVPKRGVAPFGFPRHFRFSDTKPTLPFLHPHPGNQRSTVAIFKGDVDSASL